ncbi:AlkZ-related protein [Paenibacillus sp. IHBB 10380]|uniref:AlkZ-related protein n=1 Tax=Paenibacillus sp. IHBB 10380 TaxID=1566358 RepID=UPI0005CF973D|nr:hypothetical protein [Paenibacillus sp. IHBB 10380]AJS58423.1 hypothetical protein UB51_07825 [Paenibacillus sp. IHBB 10380]
MANLDHKEIIIHTYDEAVKLIEQIGILPLASMIPGHPSLVSVTAPNQWHSDTDNDPWKWRTRFPGDGAAAYGKMMKKKAVLISREWFPYVLKVVSHTDDPNTRYHNGLMSKAAVEVYRCIQEQEGIDTRALRGRAGMKAKEMKTAFDNAVLELQGNLDIVISGVKEKVNELGEQNGWNSTSYETVGHWMEGAGMKTLTLSREEASFELSDRLESVCSAEAVLFLRKQFQMKSFQ